MIDRSEEEIYQNWKNRDIVVSICTITYNHQDFVSDALDSFLSQETTFAFEIVIDDDCSTDNTASIIREYQKKYPNIIKANLREKNIGAMPNFVSNMDRAKGKYIALCEGDDYWIDNYKLQEQFNCLEKNLQCSFSFHNVNIVNSKKDFLRKHSKGRASEYFNTGVIYAPKIVSAPLTVPHTSSIFFRKVFLDLDYFNFLGDISCGDYPLIVLLCDKGNGYYFDNVMSEYRQNMVGLSSNRSYGYNDKLLLNIKETHYKMNYFFNQKFKKEIKNHLNGQFMVKFETELYLSIEKKSIFQILKSFIYMLIHTSNSQYSLYDVIWIFKNSIIKNWIKKDE